MFLQHIYITNPNILFSDPDSVLLYVEAGPGLVGFIAGDNNEKYIVGKSPRPVAVAYDPVDEVGDVIW